MGVDADVTEVGEYSAGSVGIELGHIRAERPNLATSTYRNRAYGQYTCSLRTCMTLA